MNVNCLPEKCQPLSVIVGRGLMIIVIRDKDLSRVDVHVNHLDPEVLLYLRPKPVYPDRL